MKSRTDINSFVDSLRWLQVELEEWRKSSSDVRHQLQVSLNRESVVRMAALLKALLSDRQLERFEETERFNPNAWREIGGIW